MKGKGKSEQEQESMSSNEVNRDSSVVDQKEIIEQI